MLYNQKIMEKDPNRRIARAPKVIGREVFGSNGSKLTRLYLKGHPRMEGGRRVEGLTGKETVVEIEGSFQPCGVILIKQASTYINS